jgi:hypothetical protein
MRRASPVALSVFSGTLGAMTSSPNDRAARAMPNTDVTPTQDLAIPLEDFEFDLTDDEIEARWTHESLTMDFPMPAPTNPEPVPDSTCIECHVRDAVDLAHIEFRAYETGDHSGPEISGSLATEDLVLINRALTDPSCVCDPSPTEPCTPGCPAC